MESIGQLIRGRRRSLGLTLQQVADRAGCAKSYLSEVETGRRDGVPSEALLGRLEVALRLATGELVRRAQWESTPAGVRDAVASLRAESDAARRLVERLRLGGLDALHRSGELDRLIRGVGGSLEGEERAGDGEMAGAGGTGGSGGAGGRSFADALTRWLPTRVPVINKVAAGYPAEFTDLGYPARVADEYLAVPEVNDPDAFAARVVGDSMHPKYAAGDLVVFSPAVRARSGNDCFVRFERDAETTFKRVYFEGEPVVGGGDEDKAGGPGVADVAGGVAGDGAGDVGGGVVDGGEGVWRGRRIRLQPLNSAYPPRIVDREEVAGLYVAVFVVRRVG